jgi:hypothetical protein
MYPSFKYEVTVLGNCENSKTGRKNLDNQSVMSIGFTVHTCFRMQFKTLFIYFWFIEILIVYLSSNL